LTFGLRFFVTQTCLTAVRVAQSFLPGIKGFIVILVVVNVDEFTQRVQKVYTKCNGSRV